MKRYIRFVAMGDLHCGHDVGLTPPQWQYHPGQHRWRKWGAIASEIWDWYKATMKALQPIDYLFVNGDAIEGKNERSGGTELITPVLDVQAEMAVNAIKVAKAGQIVMTYGTPYHVSPGGEDIEDRIRKDCGARKLGSHEWVEVKGTGIGFDLKHHIGSSSIPHGRATALARENLWSQLWALRKEQPRAEQPIVIRSHAHYYIHVGEKNWLGMILPALQGMGSKHGARKCSGTVDVGLVEFIVDRHKGTYTWQPHLAEIRAQKAQALIV